MSQTIEIESIRRLDVKPGETLLVQLSADYVPYDVRRVASELKANLPDGVHVVVTNGKLDFTVVARATP